MSGKVVLAYSGGLDTSAAIKWIQERYHMDVVTLTVDVGNEKDFTFVKSKALKVGALKALVADAQESFIKDYVFPALMADAIYQATYPLATALSRPLIARLLVEAARQEGASAVAHGCTGKGNDQVRFEVAIGTLAPDLEIIAPARDWGMTRPETIAYAEKHGIPVPTTVKSPYSVDENLWGRSVECGILENPWEEPPEEVYAWTKSAADCPDRPTYVEIEFQEGIPVALDGHKADAVRLVRQLHQLAGANGVGRVDHIEDRLVGIKSREIYEAPAAVVLLTAHQALEAMNLSRDQLRFKRAVAAEYADMVYNGLWFSRMHEDLQAYVASTQRYVSGTIRVRLFKGSCAVVGRKSSYSLYRHELATYDEGDLFNQQDSPGFIHIWGLSARTQERTQPHGKADGGKGQRT